MLSVKKKQRKNSIQQLLYIKINTGLTFNGDNQLRNDGQYFGAPVFQHIVDTLPGEELPRMGSFAQSVEEQRQVVVVVQLLYLHLVSYEAC